MKIFEVAELCHVVLRAYALQRGDNSVSEWRAAADLVQEADIAGVQFVLSGLRRGIHIAAWDIHNATVSVKLEQGWTYGEKKDEEAKTSPMLVPFDKLSKDDQRKSYLFVAVIEACYRAGIEE